MFLPSLLHSHHALLSHNRRRSNKVSNLKIHRRFCSLLQLTATGYRTFEVDVTERGLWPFPQVLYWAPFVAVDCIALNYWSKHKRKMAIRGN